MQIPAPLRANEVNQEMRGFPKKGCARKRALKTVRYQNPTFPEKQAAVLGRKKQNFHTTLRRETERHRESRS